MPAFTHARISSRADILLAAMLFGRPSSSASRRFDTAARRSASNMHSPCGMLLSAVSKRPASRLTSRLATTASSRTRRSRSEMNFTEAKNGTSTKAKIV